MGPRVPFALLPLGIYLSNIVFKQKQLKTIVANKSNEKLANKRLETMKGGKNSHVK